MEWVFKISSLIKHGKALSIVKPLINIVFVAGITYSIMNKVYGDVNLPDCIQLKPILEYFLKGYFIIPFSIFFIIWTLTSYIFEAVFRGMNSLITEKIKSAMLDFTFIKSFGSYENELEKIKVMELARTPKRDWAVKIYEGIRKSLPNAKVTEINNRLKRATLDYTSDFILLFRSIIAVVIYFNNISSFGWGLLFVIVLTQLIISFFLIIGFQLATLLPIVAVKYHKEYEQYKRQEKLIINSNPEIK